MKETLPNHQGKTVAIIGGGPGGLMAAEILAEAGFSVTVYERKPTLGRKFLMAGRGGLNLTHSEDLPQFMTRYGAAADRLRPAIENFPPAALRAWCEGLGQPTFIGTSGRVFPKSLKASPLLRAWQTRLAEMGVFFSFQKEWQGWNDDDALVFTSASGATETIKPDITILALGGASWPKLGSDGNWVSAVEKQGIPVIPFRSANCGFVVPWSEIFRNKNAGQPLKPVTVSFANTRIQGEAMISAEGIEGGVIYALSAQIRNEIEKNGTAVLMMDLRPGLSYAELYKRLSTPRGTQSFSNFLRKEGGLSPAAIALVREIGGKDVQNLSVEALVTLIKSLPLPLHAPFSLDRAISSAGGIALNAVDEDFMLKKKPNVYAIGEMLDWEAPTGGYLLQATFSTAAWAAQHIIKQLN